jgi:lipopolysaccharide export system protein LptA
MKDIINGLDLLLSNNAFAQSESKAESSIEDLQFSCDRVKFNDDQNILELLGNVFFKTEIIEVKNADKIVYDKSKNEILVF